MRYRARFKKRLNLNNPQTLNEKILHMSLRTDTTLWTRLADKYAVRGYVEECGLDDSATAEHGAGTIFQHPDTKYSFAGNGIQNWASVKSQIEQIANKLIDFKDIALDIAITEDNVLLVEFNFRYGIEHQQCVVGGVRQILGVPNH